jgi:hypothetical protein
MRNKLHIKKERNYGNILKSIVFLICIVCQVSVTVTWAETYYIDYVSGNDLYSGKSVASPFKHCPGDPRASDNADILLSAGDIVAFKGGVTYAFTSGAIDDYIAANANGTEGNEITYISGHLHSTQWPNANERAVIDGAYADLDYAKSITGIISLKNYSNIIVKGLEIKNQTEVNNYIGEIGWKGNSGGNITIEDCILHNGGGVGVIFQGRWNAGSYPRKFAVKNCIIYDHNYHNVMTRAGVTDVLVENCTLHDGGKEIYPGAHEGDGVFTAIGGTAELSNLTIKGNTIYDHPIKGHTLIAGDNILVENNYCYTGDDGTAFGIGLATFPDHSSTGIIVRNNLVVANPGYRFDGLIRVNLTSSGSTAINGLDIYNNTLIGKGADNIIWFNKGYSSANPAVSNVTIINNILDSESNTGYMIKALTGEVTSNFIVENNHYHWGTNSQPFYWEGRAGDFSYWQSVLGFDTFAHIQNMEPSLDVNYMPDSPNDTIVNTGIDLSGEGFFEDKNGVDRPQGGGWDIGAYEFDEAPPPPEGLRLM